MRNKIIVQFQISGKREAKKLLELLKESKEIIKQPIYFAEKVKFKEIN